MAEPIWRVVVLREIDDEARTALGRIGATHISGHGVRGTESNSILVRAESEAAARGQIQRAFGPEVVIREARMTPLLVEAPIPPEAIGPFQEAAGEDERVGGVIEDEDSDDAVVYFELPGGSVVRAFNEARGIYRRVMEAAGLEVPEDLELTASGFEVFMGQATRDRQLLDQATELYARSENELAVIVAQTACEVLIADAMRNFIPPHASEDLQVWLLARVRTFSLIDDSTRDLWDRITGTQISQEGFWADYREHVKRRNSIVHEGETVERSDAEASMGAATELFGYVEGLIGEAPPG